MNVKCDTAKMNEEKFMGWNHFRKRHFSRAITRCESCCPRPESIS